MDAEMRERAWAVWVERYPDDVGFTDEQRRIVLATLEGNGIALGLAVGDVGRAFATHPVAGWVRRLATRPLR